MKSATAQSTTWSSLLSCAIRAAQVILRVAGRRKRDIARLNQAEIDKAADFTQFFYRLREKINHHAEGQLHAALVVGEELRFFFGAQAAAVFQNGRCVHRSLTQNEFEKLTQKIVSAAQDNAVPTCRIEPISFTESERQEIGANDNLGSCTTLTIGSRLGKSSQWTIWLWSGSESERLKVFQPPNSGMALEFWQRVGGLLDLASTSEAEATTEISSLSPPERATGKDDFLKQYEERFLPLDSILEPLRRRIAEELQDYLQVAQTGVSCAFSVRHREQDAVHFYITARQAREAVTSDADIEPLRKFSSFCYGPGEALSGWVMETGACLYLENFTTSNLWRRYIGSNGTTNPARAEQLARVAKFFHVENGNLKHAYLIPVLLQRRKDAQGSFHLRTDLMLSITMAKELEAEKRQHIFELVQRLGDAVAVALRSQQIYESAIEQMTIGGLLQPLARFVTHDLRGSAQRLQLALGNANTTASELQTKCGTIVGEVSAICSVVEAYHEYLSAGRVLVRESVDDFKSFLEKTWSDTWNELIGSAPETQIIKAASAAPQVGQMPATFRVHKASFSFVIRHLLKNSVHAMKTRPTGNVRLSMSYDGTKELVRLEFWDNGPGMTPVTRQLVLADRRVSRVPGTDQDKQDGYSGFGMYFIRLFCRAHNARIQIPFTNEEKPNECLIVVEFLLSDTTSK